MKFTLELNKCYNEIANHLHLGSPVAGQLGCG